MKTASFSTLSRVICLAAMLLIRFPATAHEPGMSTAMVTVGEGNAEVVLTFSKEEIDAIVLTLDTGAKTEMESLGGRLMIVSGKAPSKVHTDLSAAGDFIFRLVYEGLPRGAMSIEAPLLASLTPGHRQYLLVRDARKELLLRRFLTPEECVVSVDPGLD
jgi:hypothetical protein